MEHYISRVADRLAGAVYQLSVDHLQACESPIETGLGVGLVSMHLLNKHFRFAAMPSASIETEWSAIIYIQPPAGDYRLISPSILRRNLADVPSINGLQSNAMGMTFTRKQKNRLRGIRLEIAI